LILRADSNKRTWQLFVVNASKNAHCATQSNSKTSEDTAQLHTAHSLAQHRHFTKAFFTVKVSYGFMVHAKLYFIYALHNYDLLLADFYETRDSSSCSKKKSVMQFPENPTKNLVSDITS
jgi:hypothetical protein